MLSVCPTLPRIVLAYAYYLGVSFGEHPLSPLKMTQYEWYIVWLTYLQGYRNQSFYLSVNLKQFSWAFAL